MKGKKILKKALKIIVATCLIVFTGVIILTAVIQKKIREQLTNLSPGMQVKFSFVRTDIFSASVFFDSLRVDFIPYDGLSQNRHSLFFQRASLRGISFLKLLVNKKFVADHFLFEEGNVQLDKFLLDKKDSAQQEVIKKIKWPFRKLFIGTIALNKLKVFLHSDRDDQLLATGNVMVGGISLDKPGGNPALSSIDLSLSELNYSSPDFSIQIREFGINSSNKVLEMDSLQFFSGRQPQNEAMISNLKITGFDAIKLLDEKVLDAETIMIGDSRIVANGNEKLNSQALPFNLKKIHAGIFQSKVASVSFKDKTKEFSFRSTINLREMNIMSTAKNGFDFASVKSNLWAIHYSGNGYHDIEIKKIELDSKNEIARIEDLKIVPRFGKYELGRKLGRQADWIEADVPKIEIIKPDIRQILHQKLFAEKILISESKAYIFRDRRLPRPQKIKPLPVAFMRRLPFDIRVKSFGLASSTVAYEEYPKDGFGQTGILRIERIKITLSPLINHPLPSDPAYLTMNVSGSFMGSGTADGNIMMPLEKNKPYFIRGTIEKLELPKLNSSSENLGKIRIKSGYLDFLFFDFRMTEEQSTGKIIGAYHHLIIQQLKKHTEEKNVADFASFMLRHLIIPLNKDKSLPEKKRTGLVNYQRDPTRFVSHYYLQSLLMGVKKSFALGFLLPK